MYILFLYIYILEDFWIRNYYCLLIALITNLYGHIPNLVETLSLRVSLLIYGLISRSAKSRTYYLLISRQQLNPLSCTRFSCYYCWYCCISAASGCCGSDSVTAGGFDYAAIAGGCSCNGDDVAHSDLHRNLMCITIKFKRVFLYSYELQNDIDKRQSHKNTKNWLLISHNVCGAKLFLQENLLNKSVQS